MSRLLQHGIAAQAEARPSAVAVVMGGARLTYAELEGASNRLARVLRATGVERGDRVVLLLRKSPAAIVSILATLKAGGIYVPLDTTGPLPRLARMLETAEPRCLLTEAAVAEAATGLLAGGRGRPAVGWVDGPPAGTAPADFTGADVEQGDGAAFESPGATSDPAYILFTSGSTGQPKGVVVRHANVLPFLDWATKYFGLGPQDRTSGHSPLHFDLSVFDVFGTLSVGGQLHLVPPDLGVAPDAVPCFIREARLTQWFSVPSVLTYLVKFDALRPGDFPGLARLLWCGEVLPTPVLRHLMRRLPHVTFTNLYGPTETTVASSYYTLPSCPDDDAAAIPIGLPCAGEELRVLRPDGRPAATGEIGDLHIAGAGVGAGYWRNEAATAAAFATDADGVRVYRTGDLARRGADGLVYFVGRADTQIKSRGYRIELGEIEAALQRLPELQESAVVALDTGGFEGATICCAYAAMPSATVTPVTLRRALGAVLPAYMLPGRWRRFERLPKNASGKVDRPTLRTAFTDSAQGDTVGFR